ncbi:FAD-binding oxidoreductase [Methylomonas sp. AM2-LC]|uniref:FAD-binding oxidoreductase n=1 Tax=Methylomonas sp. AM2-LC TaxID=3153301 RepID=UPI003266A7F1
MTQQALSSWGRVLTSEQSLISLTDRSNNLPNLPEMAENFLPYGNGRSYGDSCLNSGGAALLCRSLNRFINFDTVNGVLSCEAGVLLAEILTLVVPQGWFLPVTPGTRFVTVGGAIANDVHGKNHHRTGTFGRHILGLELLRSDGQRLFCAPDQNQAYFAATIGGLGLTGVISYAQLQLQRIRSPWVSTETIRYDNLDDFFELCDASDQDYEYTVSWVDCAGTGKRLGRGLFMRGNHAPAGELKNYQSKTRTFPLVPPISMINALTLKAFNTAYYYKQIPRQSRQIQHYEPFFYPLDGLLEWNRMYGPRGFYQYQCVIPTATGKAAITDLLTAIANSGMGSFLAVLKLCGDVKSPGMLSFPLPGVSLALDFPNRGAKLHQLFERLDTIVSQAGGRLYPAKDGRMPGSLFRSGYQNWQAFSTYIDPQFSSSFWRRVMEDK